MKTKKIDYEKAYKLARENEILHRRMEKRQTKDREIVSGFNCQDRNYKEEGAEREKVAAPKQKDKKGTLMCSLDGTPCNGLCRNRYTVAGEVKCREVFISNSSFL